MKEKTSGKDIISEKNNISENTIRKKEYIEKKEITKDYWIKKGLQLAASFVISVLFLLLYSNTTSPFTSYFGEDSAFYAMVGAGMKHGLLPYRDFYEMKGPYMFWLQFLGQVLSEGRFGAFCIQTVNLTLTVFIVIQIFNLILNDKLKTTSIFRIVIQALLIAYCLFVVSLTFEGGNLTEEFSFPMMVLCLYFCLKYFQDQENGQAEEPSDHPLLIGFFYGAAFGYFSFIRVINAAFLGAILLSVVIYLIIKKNWSNILKNGIAFIGGTVVCMLPPVIWAAANGILKDLINQVFLLAFSYSTEISAGDRIIQIRTFIWPMMLIALIPICVLAVFLKKNWKLWILSITSAVILLVAVSMGDCYLHYFSLQLPNCVLGAYIFLLCISEEKEGNAKKIKTAASLLLIMIFLLMQKEVIQNKTIFIAKESLKSALNGNPEEFDMPFIREIMRQIPEEEQNSVYLYGFGSCSQWYAKAGIFPPNRYCDWQPHWIILHPEIKDELAETLSSGELKWVVLPTWTEVWPEEINAVIYGNYTEYFRNEYYLLMRQSQ